MNNPGHTVLIVDDEYAFCKAMKQFFEKLGYRTLIATDGQHALDQVSSESPDLMTLDIRMPGLDGQRVLNKAKFVNSAMRIVVITAIDVPRMEEMLEHSGAHAVLRKPVDLQQLRETVAKLLA